MSLVSWQPGQVSVCCEMPLPPQSFVDFIAKAPLAKPVVAVERGAAQAPGLPSMVRRRARDPREELLHQRIVLQPRGHHVGSIGEQRGEAH